MDVKDARTSSYSGNSGGNCVRVGTAGTKIAVQDTKNPDGRWLTFGRQAWQAFAARVKTTRP